MKGLLTVALLLLGLLFVTLGQTTGAGADDSAAAKHQSNISEDAILKLENEELDAFRRNDTKAAAAFVERVFAADFIVTGAEGRTYDKAAALADVKDTRSKYESLTRDDVKVHVYGDAAVVTGRMAAKVQTGGQSSALQIRYTNFYVKHRGNWQRVASQATMISP